MSASSTRLRPVCQLATGGMGTVELCVKEEGVFRRRYAVKRLHRHLHDDPEFLEMFFEEARVAGMLEHPNAVAVHEVSTDVNGPFLVMDYVEGVDLSCVQRLLAQQGVRMPVQLAAQIALDAAQGLHAAHELRDATGASLELVHRDVSPQNVLLGYDGSVRITDFGIAKALGRTSRTATGVMKGKLAYMSPEQVLLKSLDRRSDLFSLGIVLYEMLAGARLYRRDVDGMSPGERILEEPPPDIGEVRPDVPPRLVELLFELLAKDPDARPSSAADVARELRSVLLELEDAPVELGAFLSDVAGETRATREAMIEDALSRAADRGTASGVARRGMRPGWVVAVVLVAVVAVAASAYVGGRAWTADRTAAQVAPRRETAESRAPVAERVARPAADDDGVTASSESETRTEAVPPPETAPDEALAEPPSSDSRRRRAAARARRAAQRRSERDERAVEREAPEAPEPSSTGGLAAWSWGER